MIVQVIRDYYDLKEKKQLRREGQIIDYKNEKRAKELIAKGVVIEKKITVVKDKAEKEEDKEEGV